MRTNIVRSLVTAVLFCSTALATETFTLDPVDGSLFGNPGDELGWGFTLTSDTYWLGVTAFEFTQTSPGSPLGTYVDYNQFNFYTVDPNVPLTVPFNSAAMTGVGSFTIPGSAGPGDVFQGQISMFYDLYTVNPFDDLFNPDTDTFAVGLSLTQNVQVTVVPEPGFYAPLVGIGAAIVGWRWKRRSRLTQL